MIEKILSPKLILIALVLIYLIIFRDFPYFNLVLQTKVIAGFIFALMIFLFSIKAELLLKIAVFLLLLSLLLILTHHFTLEELMGELIYFLLILAFIKKFNDFRRLV